MASDPKPQKPLCRSGKRGEPIVIFVMLLLLWAGLRALTWEWSVTRPAETVSPMPRLLKPMRGVEASPAAFAHSYVSSSPIENRWLNRREEGYVSALSPPSPMSAILSPQQVLYPDASPQHHAAFSLSGSTNAVEEATQQLLYLAAMADLPLPMKRRTKRRNGATVATEPGKHLIAGLHANRDALAADESVMEKGLQSFHKPGIPSLPRWSGDGWLLMRQGGNSHALAGGSAPYGPTYGANQIGAVLRYRLMPAEAHKLTAYVRAYGALNGTGEREAAVGLSLRPVPALPVVVMAEMRASQFQSGRTHARPALGVVTEMAPLRITHRLEAETYVQAGYVGGAAGTPFVDGQLRLEDVLADSGSGDMRIGVGLWGGGQKGADRLDIGPTMRLGWHDGRVGARVAIDYRIRVTGNAMPTSGPAVTLSAGF